MCDGHACLRLCWLISTAPCLRNGSKRCELGGSRALADLGRKEEAKAILEAGIEAATSGKSNGGGDLVPEMRTVIQQLG